MLDIGSGLKAAVQLLETAPVRLPWLYYEGDKPYAIELDVPSIRSARWDEALRATKADPLSITERVKLRNEVGVARAVLDKDADGLGVALESSEYTRNSMGRSEGIGNINQPTLLIEECRRLCENGKGPAPITQVVTSGRIVPVKVRESAATRVRQLQAQLAAEAGITDAEANRALPVDESEMEELDPVTGGQVRELVADDIKHVMNVDGAERALPYPEGENVTTLPQEVAVLRFLLAAAMDEARYVRSLAEAKKKPSSGGSSEKSSAATRRSTKSRRSRAAPKK